MTFEQVKLGVLHVAANTALSRARVNKGRGELLMALGTSRGLYLKRGFNVAKEASAYR